MKLSGKATAVATQTYAQQFSHLPFNTIANGSLTASQIGLGTYRMTQENETHRAALQLALQQGINLIDTSTNYGDGASERLIGDVLGEVVQQSDHPREAFVVVSKVGYLQGQAYEMARRRRRQGRPFPNLVKYSKGLDHCIHPEFIEDQLQRTLDRLQLETVDVYLLHNPEYYLSWAKVANIPQHQAQATYYQRIRLAFDYLETAVAKGHIQWYGISSNSFPLPADAYTTTSLEKVLTIAQSISPSHHFRFIQLPLNLLETGGITEKNCPEQQSTLAFAHTHHIDVLINRPLNAFDNNQLVRLADIPLPNYPTTVEEVSTSVDSLVKREAQFAKEWLPLLKLDPETARQLLEYLALGQMLDGQWQGFGSYQNWLDLQSRFFIPRAQSAIEYLSNAEATTAEFLGWLDAYIDLFNETLLAVTAFYQEVGGKEVQAIWETAVSIDPAWHADTLSQTAVRALRSTQGVSCTLVGMRQPAYVQEMLADLAKPPIEKAPRLDQWNELGAGVTTSPFGNDFAV